MNESGQKPYFVKEEVNGEPVLSYYVPVLTLSERIRIFNQENILEEYGQTTTDTLLEEAVQTVAGILNDENRPFSFIDLKDGGSIMIAEEVEDGQTVGSESIAVFTSIPDEISQIQYQRDLRLKTRTDE